MRSLLIFLKERQDRFNFFMIESIFSSCNYKKLNYFALKNYFAFLIEGSKMSKSLVFCDQTIDSIVKRSNYSRYSF